MKKAKLITPVKQTKDAHFLGAGWSFPPRFDLATGQIGISSKQQNIKQSIDLILQTQKGSRSTNPSFGSTLNKLMFRRYDSSLESEISHAIETALLNFEPRINVEQVQIAAVNEAELMLEVSISYSIKLTNSRDNHVFPFYLNEASNLPDT